MRRIPRPIALIPGIANMSERSGIRTWVGVALRKDDGLLGAIIVYRREVRPFSESRSRCWRTSRRRR